METGDDDSGAANPRPHPRRLRTEDLTPGEIGAIRGLMLDAFGSDDDDQFTDQDWDHAVGGLHFVLDLGGAVVTHASVVEREIRIGERACRTGYVEAVATATTHQGTGLGSLVMAEVSAHIAERYELGVLGTGRQHFYERLGWLRWLGPAYVRTGDGDRRTPDDEGHLLVLPTPSSPPFDRTEPISCDWRPGDVW